MLVQISAARKKPSNKLWTCMGGYVVEVQGAFVNYFQELFTTGADIDIEPRIRHLARRVTPHMNE
jgi:hypothetical protein